ncbi:MAG: glutathione peroxidase [Betaproteobacteria bacterium TMED156]|nr:MAG: glutathione peroxidase [Betaproteobacteria bacterium TMED156]
MNFKKLYCLRKINNTYILKDYFLLFILIFSLFYGKPLFAQEIVDSPNSQSISCTNLLNVNFPRLQDEKITNLCDFQGKVILVVNTASFCGFTKQYRGLEKLYKKYKDSGLVVLGFPSNDFGKQEPGSNKEIADFCENTYGVKFPMFAKSIVRGSEANVLFFKLASLSEEPRWNFHKYLINKNGEFVRSYSSFTSPNSRKLILDIEKLLAKS